jgi:hypothetical protein
VATARDTFASNLLRFAVTLKIGNVLPDKMKLITMIFALTCCDVLALTAQNTAPSPTAKIHVYRPNTRIFGIGSHPSIYCDGKELTRLYRGTIFTAWVAPGKHLITGGRSEVGQLVDMEPGKDYYFRFAFDAGKNLSGAQPFTLSVVSEDEARSERQNLRGLK